ncbi:MAG: metallophosphoesterase family protein, partial [Myxococcales bacterium]|nr:metallophosphoesterase family protein [Myxococcales bacterium]
MGKATGSGSLLVSTRGARGALRRAVALAAVLGTAGLCTEALAAPSHVRVSFVGPTHTTFGVTWNTTAAGQSLVEYGVSPGSYGPAVSGSSFVANGALGIVHEVVLTGLAPSTTYYYRAGNPADGWSNEYSFRTGPTPHAECGSFRFAYLGDNRPDPIFGGGENYAEILSQAMTHAPAFVLNGGDLVVDGDAIDQWQNYLTYNDDAAAFVPSLASLGNHDTGPGQGDGANYNQLFALPRSTGPNGSDTEDYYFFRYGNAIFVALSTETYKDGQPAFAKQAAWLDEVLTQNPARWKIVYLHKPIYTHEVWFSISHPPNEEGQNAALVPVFDAHHVDVVLASHNHWYERYAPSACATQGDPGSNDACPVGDPAAGTVYYVSGGAGAFTIPGLLCGSATGREMCSGDHHYLVFDVADEKLDIATWGAYPQQNQVFDLYSITKPAVDCTGVGGSGAGGAG